LNALGFLDVTHQDIPLDSTFFVITARKPVG
jgi:hypothetical protein